MRRVVRDERRQRERVRLVDDFDQTRVHQRAVDRLLAVQHEPELDVDVEGDADEDALVRPFVAGSVGELRQIGSPLPLVSKLYSTCAFAGAD